MVRSITVSVPDRLLLKDLEKYRKTDIELGSAASKIMTTDKILIDERVRAKCFLPACGSLGKNACCPPHAPDLNFVRKVVKNFQSAIFYTIKVASSESAGKEFRRKKLGIKAAMKNWEIAGKICGKAFYDGYPLAMGFAGGPYEPYLCNGSVCDFLAGKGCKSLTLSRPSMDALGMNAFTMDGGEPWVENLSHRQVSHPVKSPLRHKTWLCSHILRKTSLTELHKPPPLPGRPSEFDHVVNK